MLHAQFEIEKLADKRADGKRDDDHSRAAARQAVVCYLEHLFERSREADEQHAKGRCLEQSVLYAERDKAPAKKSGEAACDEERDIDDGSESDHGRCLSQSMGR